MLCSLTKTLKPTVIAETARQAIEVAKMARAKPLKGIEVAFASIMIKPRSEGEVDIWSKTKSPQKEIEKNGGENTCFLAILHTGHQI